MRMKNVLTLILTLAVSVVFAQQKDKALLKSNDFIYEHKLKQSSFTY